MDFMKIIKFAGMISFICTLAVCISIGVCVAEETSGKTANKAIENNTTGEKDLLINPLSKKTDIGDWRITVGGTYSRPKLTKANRDIHSVESQLRQTAPGVEKFEDWDDIFKGTVRMGISA
jgi:hypothetical protein